MTPEELENALFINNMVVKAPYQDCLVYTSRCV